MKIAIPILAAFAITCVPSAQAAPKLLYTFTGANGFAGPSGPLIQVNGLLYGIARSFGNGTASAAGLVYSLNPATKAFNIVYNLPSGDDPGTPQAPVPPLTEYNGMLYGTADGGPNGDGVVFEVNPVTSTGSVIYNFQGGSDGWLPQTGVVAYNGLLYGTTALGGNGYGTIFTIDPASGKENIVYSFPAGDNRIQGGDRLVSIGGILYGTASNVISNEFANSVIFSFNPSTATLNVLYSMNNETDGADPGGLLAANGLLYGAAQLEGPGPCVYGISIQNDGCGTIFSFNPTTRSFTVLHAFTGEKDGVDDYQPLTYLNGYLYGTTLYGGSKHCYEKQGCGTIFRVNATTGAEQILYAFTQGGPDTANGTIAALGGKLYGTVSTDPKATWGAIFSIKP